MKINFGSIPSTSSGQRLAITNERGAIIEQHLFSAWGEIALVNDGNGRFLAPDNFVQDPYNTQNFNRYGYVLNNPLIYNDPSGEIINVLIGVAIGVVVNGINNSIHNVGFFKGAIGAAFMVWWVEP